MHYNPKQHLASDPAHSVWVTASAGSGKTKVLTDRVLRLLLSGTAPHRILCLTFTKAAAAEMANRINNELAKWVIADDLNLASRITLLTGKSPDNKTIDLARSLFTRIVDNSGDLKILTIHSFCQSLLKRFPLEANIAPHFTVTDDQTAQELITEAWLRLITLPNVESEKDRKVKYAISHIAANVHDSTLSKIISEVMSKRAKLYNLFELYGVEGLISEIYTALGIEKTESEDSIIKGYSPDVDGLRYLYRALSKGTEKNILSAEGISDWIRATDAKKITDFNKYSQIFLTLEDSPRKISGILVKALRDEFPECEGIIIREQEKLAGIINKLKSLRTAIFTESLIHISEAVLEIYRRLKITHAFLDYDDLILITQKLLNDPEKSPWIMYKLDGGIDHILVDEAQDTSPEQWQIISSLCTEFFTGESSSDENRTFFVVGDEKQSIFSFQGADPAIFNKMRQFFGQIIKSGKKSWQPVSLDLSFRSTDAILQAVDSIFANESLRQSISTIADEIKHTAHRTGHTGVVELWPLVIAEEKKSRVPWQLPIEMLDNYDSRRILARQIADTIKDWLKNGRLLPSKGRSIIPSDIMVLVRRRDDFVKMLAHELEQRNIPIAGIDRMILTDHIAVMDLIALGNFLLLPTDDLTLATILKSPLIGLNEDELFNLAYDRGKSSLWDRLKNSQHTETCGYLLDLLNKVDFLNPFALYSYILEIKGGRAKFIARLSDECRDPLDEFINLTEDFARTHTPSLQGFLHWIASGKSEIKRDLEQQKDDLSGGEIRIMTVHGAKGLQSPIVFLPDTTSIPYSTENLLFDNMYGGLMFWSGSKQNRSDLCQELIERKTALDKNEYLRLLYVALTRAEDELYICGWQNQKAAPEDCWYNIVQRGLESRRQKTENIEQKTEGREQKTEGREQSFSSSTYTYVSSDKPPLAGDLSPYIIPKMSPRRMTWSTENAKHFQLLPTNVGEQGAGESVHIKNNIDFKFQNSEEIKLPDFATKPPQPEPFPTVPLTPSHNNEIESAVLSPLRKKDKYAHGKLLHLLLQVLPDINKSERQSIGEKLLNLHGKSLTAEQKKKILEEIYAVIDNPQFAEIFAIGSQAEVAITGKVGNRIISGQVDRLVVTEDKVLIIDYKTNREVPTSVTDIPAVYLKQMAAYRDVLQLIYPQKKINCALLWTADLQMMMLDSENRR